MSKQTKTESGPQSGLHGELKLAEARLLPARLRVMVAGMILAVTIPLEWAFGFDFFAEFGRDALGEIGGFDLAIAALKGLMLLSAVVILKYALQALSADARKKLFWTAGALTVAMLLGVGLARNDLMHLRHLELGGSGEIAVDAELAALGLETQTTQSAQSQVDTPTAADLQNDLLHHTAFSGRGLHPDKPGQRGVPGGNPGAVAKPEDAGLCAQPPASPGAHRGVAAGRRRSRLGRRDHRAQPSCADAGRPGHDHPRPSRRPVLRALVAQCL